MKEKKGFGRTFSLLPTHPCPSSIADVPFLVVYRRCTHDRVSLVNGPSWREANVLLSKTPQLRFCNFRSKRHVWHQNEQNNARQHQRRAEREWMMADTSAKAIALVSKATKSLNTRK
ncbi:hypothetical protein Ddye_027510 [Dipteronia dyeriana]|uniref:Uncharacterized protein n=1 Tax=Dipteronia dyeriana TaxID=168575 RepID=A0AAD9TQ62_9ROSI|nr:hypothetical protein Ddye_027510 [Dipteronia dyeriana]